uniref:Tetratricopeptide repeat protein 36 n=1 Tax=Sphenodon punctatus TaxID=8508 RepID=A0A8D0GF56_SPHPU
MATANDRAVLQTIFKPNTPFGDIPGLDEEEETGQEEEMAFAPELLGHAKDLELQGVSAAESGDLRTALESFALAIQILPERASGYNNRAQVLRLQGDVAGALEDLATALRLSRGRGRVACQAFVQRGLICRLQGCEEEAQRDWEQAARLGSAFASRQLVRMNPYAALCNQMLSEMMGKLQEPGVEREEPSQGGSPGGKCG